MNTLNEMDEIDKLLNECDILIKNYKQDTSTYYLERVRHEAPWFYEYEKWYQDAYQKYSDAYREYWYFNVGESLYYSKQVQLFLRILIIIRSLLSSKKMENDNHLKTRFKLVYNKK